MIGEEAVGAAKGIIDAADLVARCKEPQHMSRPTFEELVLELEAAVEETSRLVQ